MYPLAEENWKTSQMHAQVLQEDCPRDGLVTFVRVKRNLIEISAGIDINLAYASSGGSVFKNAK